MSIQAIRRTLFSSDYDVFADNAPVTVLDLARVRSRAFFELGPERYTVRPEGLTHGSYILEIAARTIARAERASLLPPAYRVRTENRMLELRSRLPGRTFVVRHGDREIGAVRPAHLFSRTALVEGLEELPMATRLFLLTIVLLRWRRRARAAASGGS